MNLSLYSAATGHERHRSARLTHHLMTAAVNQRTIRPQSKFARSGVRLRTILQLHLEKSFTLNRDIEFAAGRVHFAGVEINSCIHLREQHRHRSLRLVRPTRIRPELARTLGREIDCPLPKARRLARRDILRDRILPTL